MSMAGPYVVTFSCGQCLSVGADRAGTSIACDCGASVRVPSLSKLREQTGAAPYESGPLDTIRRMVSSGELPEGTCAVSGRPTSDVLGLTVVVSDHLEPTQQARARSKALLGRGMLRLFFELLRDDSYDYRPVPGTEIPVFTPLYLEAHHQRRAHKVPTNLLKRWLRTVPIYAKLLDAYPYATVRLEGRREPL